MSSRFAVLPRIVLPLLLLTPFTFAQQPIVHMTAAQDRYRTMDLLNMSLIRLGKDTTSGGSFPANYDESKANPFPSLPDPLLLNGKKKEITSAKLWWEKRRPEIVEDFDREVYGRVPANVPGIVWELKSTTDGQDGDTATKVETLVGHVDNSAYPLLKVDIQLLLTIPAGQTHPVPVILSFDRATTSQHQVLSHGWGYATLAAESIQQDDGARLTEGIIGLVNQGQPRKLEDWGALRAWAWGASRALDYLATNPAVDAKQVGIEGHSRYGKAALVAMAYDQRFAIAYISSSGEGGAKLARRNYGEALENLTNINQYHWMAGNFLRYAGPLGANDLPVDAHELIALCAPRPIFIGGGTPDADGWADPRGAFMAEAAAGPVYRLLGKKDLNTDSLPAPETSLIAGDLAFRQHSEGPTPDPNWPTFLTFASRYLTPTQTVANSNRQVASVSASNR